MHVERMQEMIKRKLQVMIIDWFMSIFAENLARKGGGWGDAAPSVLVQ